MFCVYWNIIIWEFNRLNAEHDHTAFFICFFCVPVIGHEMSVWTSKFRNFWSQIEQIWLIFTHLKWVAVADRGRLQVGGNWNKITLIRPSAVRVNFLGNLKQTTTLWRSAETSPQKAQPHNSRRAEPEKKSVRTTHHTDKIWLYILLRIHFCANNYLTLTTQKYFYTNHRDQRVFKFEIIVNVSVSSFCFIWIPYVMGLRPVFFFYLNAWAVFKRQNLTNGQEERC